MDIQIVEKGGVTSALGFQAAGVCAGFKRNKMLDLAVLYSEKPCHFAGTFTSNLFPAAPVKLCKERCLNQPVIRAAVINSGVANACAGEGGYGDSVKTAELMARELKITPEEVMISSTGRIGVRLPMDKIENGIVEGVAKLSRDGGDAAAHAIMTTDTRPKQVAYSFMADGKKVTIGGMCKGAGMIAPTMTTPHATMLCYITTDADASNAFLTESLGEAVTGSFNCVTVDGDMSTNDTVIVMANGESGVRIEPGTETAAVFKQALRQVAEFLARAIAMDGEGATKFVTVNVTGALSDHDAELCARTIANSMLCKTAWFGADPNWGRVLAAAGRSGISFRPDKVNLDFDDTPSVRNGVDSGIPGSLQAEVLKKKAFSVNLDLGSGKGKFTVWTCDISYDYVKINADYHT